KIDKVPVVSGKPTYDLRNAVIPHIPEGDVVFNNKHVPKFILRRKIKHVPVAREGPPRAHAMKISAIRGPGCGVEADMIVRNGQSDLAKFSLGFLAAIQTIAQVDNIGAIELSYQSLHFLFREPPTHNQRQPAIQKIAVGVNVANIE